MEAINFKKKFAELTEQWFPRIVAQLVLVAFFTLLVLYPLLHELGHLAAAKLFGGTVYGLKLGFLQARAYFSGNFSPGESSIVHISGFSLPFVVWVVFMILLPSKTHRVVKGIALFYSSMVIGSMLAWMVIPILFEFGKAPSGDDVTRFMLKTPVNGFVVSGSFLVLMVLSVLLFVRRVGNFKTVVKEVLGP